MSIEGYGERLCLSEAVGAGLGAWVGPLVIPAVGGSLPSIVPEGAELGVWGDPLVGIALGAVDVFTCPKAPEERVKTAVAKNRAKSRRGWRIIGIVIEED
jgi:hypothetical protein